MQKIVWNFVFRRPVVTASRCAYKCFGMFKGPRSVKSAVFMDYEPLKLNATHTFETSGTNYPATQHHIPEDLKLQLHRC